MKDEPIKIEGSPWIEPDPATSRQVIRLACIFCPDLFQPDIAETRITTLKHIKDYVLTRIANKSEELYGFCLIDNSGLSGNFNIANDFHPLDFEGEAFNLFEFIVESDNNKKIAEELEGLKLIFKNYKNPYKRVGVYLPLKDWVYSAELSELSKWEFYEESPELKLQVWSAELSFSKTYKLYEIIYYKEQKHARAYLLIKWDENDEAVWKPINGRSNVIHEIWKEQKIKQEKDFILNKDNCIDYLKFFCWAIEGEEGNFIVSERICELPWTAAPDPIKMSWKKVRSSLKEITSFEPDANNSKFIVKTKVVYCDAIFKTLFEITVNDDLVEMVNDHPLIEELPFKTERFASNYLNELIKPHPPKEDEYIEHRELPEDHPETIGNELSAAEFLKQLESEPKGKISNKKINTEILINDYNVKSSETNANDKIIIQNCWFDEEVRLSNRATGPSIEFRECVFAKKFSANDTSQHKSIIFNNCLFNSSYNLEENSEIKTTTDEVPKNNLTDQAREEVIINLQNLRSEGDLSFINCRIMGKISAENMKLSGNLSFRGCLIAYSPVRKRVIFSFMSRSIADLKNKEVIYVIKKKIIFKRSEEVIYIDDEKITHKTDALKDGPIIKIDNSFIKGNLEVSIQTQLPLDKQPATVIAGSLSGQGIEVNGSANFFGSLIIGGFNCNNSTFHQDVNFNGYSWNRIQFRLAKGSMNLSNCKIAGSLKLNYAEIEGDINLYGIHVDIHVRLFALRSTGDLNLDFSNIKGMMAAYRNDLYAWNREILEVGGSLRFSAANINEVRLEGINVKGIIEAITGNFNSIRISIGMGYNNEAGKFSPVGSRAQRLHFTAIRVQSELDLCGIALIKNKFKINKNIDTTNTTIQSSYIGHNVLFFNENSLRRLDTHLRDLVGKEEDTRNYIQGNNFFSSGERIKEYPSLIDGDLIFQANVIGGKLDLRNLEVENSIRLNDTSVSLDIDLNTFYKSNIPGKKISGLNTKYVSIDLSNVKVGKWNIGGKEEKEEKTADDYKHIFDKMDPFDRSVYLDIENKLRNETNDSAANEIYRRMRKRVRYEKIKHTKTAGIAYWRDWLYGFLTGYGTRMWILLIGYLVIFVLVIIILHFPRSIQPYPKDGWLWGDAVTLASRYCIPFVKDSFKEGIRAAALVERWVLLLAIGSNILLSLGIYGIAENMIRKK